MKKLLFTFLFSVFFLFSAHYGYAQTSQLPSEPTSIQEYFVKAEVIRILGQKTQVVDGYQTIIQTIQLKILEGKEQNKLITLERGNDIKLAQAKQLNTGTQVILDVISHGAAQAQYTISDTYRLQYLLYLGVIFFLIIIGFAGRKGFGAIIGLGVSLFIIMIFIIPQILNHQDPLLISILGSMAILVTTTYLAHGFSKQTTIAVVSTCIALLATVAFAVFAVNLARLAGLGTEDSYLLDLNPTQSINPQGLLLGGILIGTLGALNDITTTQVATIFAISRHNSKLSLLELAEQGFMIGREHIVSLVNTLVLAYAGSSLTIFIFFVLNPAHLPVWVILNNESVAEEIVRTIAGSFGLVLAVPITSFLAAWFATRRNNM